MGHTQPTGSGAVTQVCNGQSVGGQTIKLQFRCYNCRIPNSMLIIEVVALTFYISPGIKLVTSSVCGIQVIAAVPWDASISMTIAECTA